MILGNIDHVERYVFLDDKIKQCFTYAKEHDLMAMEPGCYPIDGENIFVNIVQYETKTVPERFWEAHRKYIDIHYMLQGPEQINLNFIGNLKQGEFKEEDDFLPLEGPNNASTVLEKGDFLICYPEDGHMTALKVGESATIKKAIFKVIV